MYIMGTIVILLLAIAAITLLRLRCRFEVAPDSRLVFVGLGRSGVELDFKTRQQVFKLFGISVKTSPMESPEDPLDESGAPQLAVESESDIDSHVGRSDTAQEEIDANRKTRTAKSKRRVRRWQDILPLIPKCAKALQAYSFGILRSIVVEELQAEIEAGFESPDLTGMTYGYYQAALAAAPGVVSHVEYRPDWTGASFSGRARGSVALPLYRLIYRSAALIWQLPLRDLIRLAIGKQRGGQDG